MKRSIGQKMAMALLALYFILELLSVYFHADSWQSLLALIAPLLAGVLLIVSYLRSPEHWKPLLIFGLTSFVWFVFKLLDALVSFGIDNSGLAWLNNVGLLPNIMLVLCASSLLISFRRLLQTIQIVFDILSSGLLSLLLIWIFFQQEVLDAFGSTNIGSINAVFAGVCDYTALVVIFIMMTTVRGCLRTNLIRVMSEAIVIFALADIWRIVAENLYPEIDVSFVNIFYVLAFLFLAVSAMNCLARPAWKPQIEDSTYREAKPADKYIRLAFFVLAFGAIAFFVKDMEINNILLLFGLGLFYQIINGLIQNGIKNQKILKMQREMNIRLEQRVTERTEQLRLSNKQLQKISVLDDVTGLFNRRYFLKELDLMLRLTKSGEHLAVFFVDLDRFKGINDTHGHDVGDKVLMIVADRLSQLKRRNAVLARLGGDEFVLAIRERLDDAGITEVARQLVDCCRAPVVIEPFHFHLTMSVGIALYPNDATESGLLMKYADIAMYQAKERGSNQYAFFNHDQKNKVIRKAKIEMLLKNADYDREFEMVYQPQFSLTDQRLIGAEALFRWNHPREGMIMPSESIHIAEETGMIIPIGSWIIRQVLQQAIYWNGELGLNLKLALNVSPRQLDHVGFVSELKKLLSDVTIQPGWLDFEITESIALKEGDRIGEILNQLSQMGISLSIDDFGTGYSSLSYLKKYPINRIKIARQLVESSVGNSRNTSILEAIIVMTKALGMTVIAEGVEEEDQLALMSELKCDEVQGYLTGRPARVAEFEEKFISKAVATAENASFVMKADQNEG